MIDFKKLLSPDTRANLRRQEKEIKNRREQSNQQLVLDAIYYMKNANFMHLKAQHHSTYDSILALVILPEMMQRMMDNAFSVEEKERGWIEILPVVRGNPWYQCLSCGNRAAKSALSRGCCGKKLK